MIPLEEYLTQKKQEVSKLRQEIGDLTKIKTPLQVELGYNEILFFSDDYKLAIGYNLESKSYWLGGESYPNGGYSINQKIIFPQFYFFINYLGENKKVLISHGDFKKREDTELIIKNDKITRGSKDYVDKNDRITLHFSIDNVISYCESKGVSKKLLVNLKEEYEKLKKLL